MTPSVSDGVPTEKGSNLSRPLFPVAGESSKKQATANGASHEPRAESSSISKGENTKRKEHVEESRCEFSDSEIDKEWKEAIGRRDCKDLIRLLNGAKGSALWKKTGEEGRTVFHVAAIQGSVELVRTLKSVLKFENFNFEETILTVKDGRCDMTAVEIAERIVGYKDIELLWGNDNPKPFGSVLQWQSGYSLTGNEVSDLRKLMNEAFKRGKHLCGEGLMKSFEENVDYNFCSEYGHLYLFHHACSRLDGREFVKDVLELCSEEQLLKLVQLRDFQGRTPVHVAVAVTPANGRDEVLRNLIRALDSLKVTPPFTMCVRNGRGWTPSHLAATQPYSEIYGELNKLGLFDRINQDDLKCCTGIHLAVLHNNTEYVRNASKGNKMVHANPVLNREIIIDDFSMTYSMGWTLFSLALMLGNIEMMEIVMGLRSSDFNEVREGMGTFAPPLICLAAALGNTDILRTFIDDPTLDPLERDCHGRTALHYAANGLIEPTSAQMVKSKRAHTYVCVEDVPNVAWLDELYTSQPHEQQIDNGYSGRKICIDILVQSGVDIWQKDNKGKIAYSGRRISNEKFISWWHEKMAKEALDMRNNLHQGGNAISIIGALIATASYVGPLQPPLTSGLDPWNRSIKIFIVSNSLSFYLAIASIMLAVAPALPMPQEALLNELERTRITMALAVGVLLLSVGGFLISYAAALMAVIPSRDVGLSHALMVGCTCLIGIALFMIRGMRLLCPSLCRRIGKARKGYMETLRIMYNGGM